MKNRPLPQELLDCLDQIEAEMRSIGYWVEDPPREGRPDDLGFAVWLQGVFLPNARASVEQNALPERSQVGLMAQREFDTTGTVDKALTLVSLLNRFDDLVQKAN